MVSEFVYNAYSLACHIQKELKEKGTVTLDAKHLTEVNTIVNIVDRMLS